MEIKKNSDLNSDEIIIRLLLKKLGYGEKIINKVCEVIR